MLHRSLVLSVAAGLCCGSSALAGPVCGVFVSTEGSDLPGGGLTTGDPVATIGFALTRAMEEGLGCVFVQRGTYAEIVRPTAGVTIDGGYDAGWDRGLSSDPGHQVRIVGGADKGTGVFASVVSLDVVGTVTLSNLVIEAPDAMGSMDGAGLSTYGIIARGTSVLMLEDVLIEAGEGADGQGGGDGSGAIQTRADNGTSGSPGGQDATCNTTRASGGLGGVGTMGNSGAPGGRGGQQDADCGFPPDLDATPGQNGASASGASGPFGGGGAGGAPCNDGAPGEPGRTTHGSGGPGGAGGMTIGLAWRTSPGSPGTLGQHGLGGGGGGGGGGCDIGIDSRGGGGGGGGAGGVRAPVAGEGGEGGGASFGIYAENTDVGAVNVEFMLGIGGVGGNGGDGGAGQPGGLGGQGGDGDDVGGPGGDGGDGGHSGAGGGGAGGHSVGVYVLGGTYSPISVIYTGGTPGLAGDGGLGVIPASDGDNGTDGARLEAVVSPNRSAGAGNDLAALVAERLDARGAACDVAPCVAGPSCDADLNNDGVVGSGDLAVLLAAWGPCP